MSETQERCFRDSVRKGLMERYDGMEPVKRRRELVARLMKEVLEAYDAAEDTPEHLGEELADVVIMCMVAASDSGIDLARALEEKRVKNLHRERKRDDG